MKIYATRSGEAFGKKLAGCFSSRVSDVEIAKYPDGQTYVRLNDIPHKEDVIIIGNTKGSVEKDELELLIDTTTSRNVGKTIVVMPYFGAGRQDNDDEDKSDVAAKEYADRFSDLCPDWILLSDLHNSAIRYFFDKRKVRVREIKSFQLFVEEISKMHLDDFIFVSADVGRLKWVRKYAEKFNVDVASIDKRREGPGKAHVCHIVGNVADKNIIFIDDMIDTGGTVIEGAEALKNAGAKDIHLFATHLVFSKDSYKKFSGSALFAGLHGTDTIDTTHFKHDFKIHSMAELFADYIKKEIR